MVMGSYFVAMALPVSKLRWYSMENVLDHRSNTGAFF